MMKRRELMMLLLGTAVTAPRALHAQQKAMPVIGYLSTFSPPTDLGDLGRGPIAQGLNESGYTPGRNVAFEPRWAEGHYDRLPALASDLVSRKVDLIVTIGGTPPALAAKAATSTIPIVFVDVGDPVAIGFVANLARPGGNLTGFSTFGPELMPKRLELLSELVSQARVIAFLLNPTNDGYTEPVISAVQEVARARGLQLPILKARSEGEIEAAFATVAQWHPDALLVGPDPFFGSRRKQIVALASHHAVPAIYPARDWAADGGLISYGIDYKVLARQAGIYAGRILKGEKPADLPVQQPTTFELVVNLKIAKDLGLTIPPSILARVDEVIE
jgi:putative ABC transport system substrate-binding protein